MEECAGSKSSHANQNSYASICLGATSDVRWSPSVSGLWKLNCDAAEFGSNGLSWGFCIRDSVGDLVAVGVKKVSVWFEAEYKEARACFWALSMAWECGYCRVLVKCDCYNLTSKLKGGSTAHNALDLV